jgi:hypothetical protein
MTYLNESVFLSLVGGEKLGFYWVGLSKKENPTEAVRYEIKRAPCAGIHYFTYGKYFIDVTCHMDPELEHHQVYYQDGVFMSTACISEADTQVIIFIINLIGPAVPVCAGLPHCSWSELCIPMHRLNKDWFNFSECEFDFPDVWKDFKNEFQWVGRFDGKDCCYSKGCFGPQMFGLACGAWVAASAGDWNYLLYGMLATVSTQMLPPVTEATNVSSRSFLHDQDGSIHESVSFSKVTKENYIADMFAAHGWEMDFWSIVMTARFVIKGLPDGEKDEKNHMINRWMRVCFQLNRDALKPLFHRMSGTMRILTKSFVKTTPSKLKKQIGRSGISDIGHDNFYIRVSDYVPTYTDKEFTTFVANCHDNKMYLNNPASH